MIYETFEERIKRAELEINTGLRELVDKYDIDIFEVYSNYMKNYSNILMNPPEGINEFDVVYNAYHETVAQYESIFKQRGGGE